MNVRVLIVDDHEIVRTAIRRLLESWGAVVCGEASSATEALERLTAVSPDVVVLDNFMRGMSGIEAILVMKATVPSVKIVLLTIDKAVLQEAKSVGADACIDKTRIVTELHDALTTIASQLRRTDRGEQGR